MQIISKPMIKSSLKHMKNTTVAASVSSEELVFQLVPNCVEPLGKSKNLRDFHQESLSIGFHRKSSPPPNHHLPPPLMVFLFISAFE
ncbi:unnamed protein product [Brassica rapa subsp. trilocularis]